MNKIFVIVVTYRGKLWYERCFTSLRNSQIQVQIIVVDNASNDGTAKYIHENFPEIHLIVSDKNLGFGQGNNIGLRYALENGADYVFLLNQDAWIEPNTISELLRIQIENNHYGILSPINLNASKKRILGGFINLVSDYENIDIDFINDLYFSRLRDVYNIKSVNASAWFLSRKILETVGGFDPIFFHYGEDDNYLQRAHYHNFSVGICPSVIIVHDAEISSKMNLHMKKDEYKRTLLLQSADINDNEMPNLLLKFLILRLLNSLIKFKFKKALVYLIQLKYLLNNFDKVKLSRIQNSKKTNSWL